MEAKVSRVSNIVVIHLIYFVSRIEEQEKFLITPFEKNLEVWRQLWRVIERVLIIYFVNRFMNLI